MLCLFVLSVPSIEIINVIYRYERVGVIVLLTMRSTEALYSDVIRSNVLCEMLPSQHASGYFLRLVSLQTYAFRLHRYHRHYVRHMIWTGRAQSVLRLPLVWMVRGWTPTRGARFFVPVQTSPGAHLASYTLDTGPFTGVKRPERGVDHPSHLAPRLKKE